MRSSLPTVKLLNKALWGYRLFNRLRWPMLAPCNVVLVTTHKCNCRCKTCNIWQTHLNDSAPPANELTLDEYEKIFKTLGNPYWVTVGGGEPFLREDIDRLVICLYKLARPVIVNMPTNGSLPEIIFKKVGNILKNCPGIKLILNLSLDQIGDKHDQLRGKKFSFALLLDTINRLKTIKSNNFTWGVNTILSKFNCQEFPLIYNYVNRHISPDSFIIENAQIRAEFMNEKNEVAAASDELYQAIDFLTGELGKDRRKKMGKLVSAFRGAYYADFKFFLRNGRMPNKCFAGICSCQIDPRGRVGACATQDYYLGDLRSSDYNFRKVWQSEQAQKTRREIFRKNCSCPLSNVAYTNMLMNFKSLLAVLDNFLKFK